MLTLSILFFSSLISHVRCPPTSATTGQAGNFRSDAICPNISTFGEYICNDKPSFNTDTCGGVKSLDTCSKIIPYLSLSFSKKGNILKKIINY